MRMGQGIIPAIGLTLKDDHLLTNVQLGTLGSLIYAGGVVGSLISMPCYNYFRTRNVVMASIILQIVSLVVFMTSKSFVQMAIARFMAGVF